MAFDGPATRSRAGQGTRGLDPRLNPGRAGSLAQGRGGGDSGGRVPHRPLWPFLSPSTVRHHAICAAFRHVAHSWGS